MEVWVLSRVPKGQPIPAGVPVKKLTIDQKWTEMLSEVFDQDMENLPEVHEGLHASKTGEVNLANYQEIRIRQFQDTLGKYVCGAD